jgi:hypothetical protein
VQLSLLGANIPVYADLFQTTIMQIYSKPQLSSRVRSFFSFTYPITLKWQLEQKQIHHCYVAELC